MEWFTPDALGDERSVNWHEPGKTFLNRVLDRPFSSVNADPERWCVLAVSHTVGMVSNPAGTKYFYSRNWASKGAEGFKSMLGIQISGLFRNLW